MLPLFVHLQAAVTLAQSPAQLQPLFSFPVQLSVQLEVLFSEPAFFGTHIARLALWVRLYVTMVTVKCYHGYSLMSPWLKLNVTMVTVKCYYGYS